MPWGTSKNPATALHALPVGGAGVEGDAGEDGELGEDGVVEDPPPPPQAEAETTASAAPAATAKRSRLTVNMLQRACPPL